MSIILDAVVLAGGIAVGRMVARKLRDRRPAEPPPPAEDAAGVPTETDPFESFACKLGDVVVRRAGHEEAWLAGALVFHEEKPLAVLFIAPEAGGDRGLLLRAGGTDLLWLSPVRGDEAPSAGEPPHAIELGGVRFSRTRRHPVRVERAGTGAPAVGATAVLAEYEGPAEERVVLVLGAQGAGAWRGVALSEGEYDVLPGGKATLDRDG